MKTIKKYRQEFISEECRDTGLLVNYENLVVEEGQNQEKVEFLFDSEEDLEDLLKPEINLNKTFPVRYDITRCAELIFDPY